MRRPWQRSNKNRSSMMRTRLMTVAIAALATAVSLNAQTPQTPAPTPQSQPQTDVQRPSPPAAQVITIAGCLQEEKGVPGLRPNVAERAGITEDFVLTNVKMAGSSSVSGIALASKYEVEGIAEADLKKHIGHQVEITGTITQASASDADPTADFRGTSIKMIAATCPAEQ
jgi:hypothetical protein